MIRLCIVLSALWSAWAVAEETLVQRFQLPVRGATRVHHGGEVQLEFPAGRSRQALESTFFGHFTRRGWTKIVRARDPKGLQRRATPGMADPYWPYLRLAFASGADVAQVEFARLQGGGTRIVVRRDHLAPTATSQQE